MSYYYDSDDDVGFRARGKETTSRYGTWEQSELEKQMFSWSLQDVLDRNLLKKKVCICVLRLSFFYNLCLFSCTAEMHRHLFILELGRMGPYIF